MPSVSRLSSSRRALAKIRLAPPVQDELPACLRNFQHSDGETAGLLFGSIRDGVAVVERLTHVRFNQPVESGLTLRERLSKGFDAAISKSKLRDELASQELIGWWCVRGGGDIRHLKSEVRFHNQRFRRISDVLLILSPGQGETASASFYARNGDLPLSSEHCNTTNLGVALRAPSTQSGLPLTSQAPTGPRSANRATQVQPVGAGGVELADELLLNVYPKGFSKPQPSTFFAWLRLARSRIRRRLPENLLRTFGSRLTQVRNRVSIFPSTWRKSALISVSTTKARRNRSLVSIVFLLASSGFCISLVHFGFDSSQPNQQNVIDQRSSKRPLQLRVDVQRDGILIRWDRDMEALRSARRAVLQIDDGPERHVLELGPDELANGSLFYRPSTANVDFHATVHAHDNSILSDDLRVSDALGHLATTDHAGKTSGQATQGLRIQPSQTENSKQPTTPKSMARQVTKDAQPPALVGTANSKSGQTPAQQAAVKSKSTNLVADRTIANAPAASKLPATQHVPANLSKSVVAQSRSETGPAPVPRASARLPASSAVHSGQSGVSRIQDRLDKDLQKYVPPRPAKTVTINAALFAPSLLAGIKQIDIELDIDETGHVTAARCLNSDKDISELLRNAVTSAAKEWVFEPAKINDKNIASKHRIVFRFTGP